MTYQVLTNARMVVDGTWRDDYALLIKQGYIEALVPLENIKPEYIKINLGGGTLLPGFIDTQVNGGGDVLFNTSPSVAAIRTIAAAHRQFGTTGFLPTLISDDLSVVAKAIAAVDASIEAGVPGVLGIHIEGPFLNVKKRGVHDATKFRVIDTEAIDLLSSLKHGKTLVTLAPEMTSPEVIAELARRNVIVAAGHSLATYEEMQLAMSAGLKGVTHLFNAMTQLESRAPGIVGAVLENKNITAGIIVDGHHVHPAALRVAFAARGTDGLMLVTDAMPSVGSQSKQFMIGSQRISVVDGACLAPDGRLAGSALDMATAVRNAMSMMQIDLYTASRMASETPAKLLGMVEERGRLVSGLRADIVHLDRQHNVVATWINGQHESHP